MMHNLQICATHLNVPSNLMSYLLYTQLLALSYYTCKASKPSGFHKTALFLSPIMLSFRYDSITAAAIRIGLVRHQLPTH